MTGRFGIVVLLCLLPRAATAQFQMPTAQNLPRAFISPILGATVDSPSDTPNPTTPAFGLAFGRLGKISSSETELAYYPTLISGTPGVVSKERVFSFFQNFLIGPTIGPIKPYGVIGFGDLLLNASVASYVGLDPESAFNNYFALSAGGGVIGFFIDHLGVRGDVRWFRAYGFDSNSLVVDSAGLALTHFEYWRLNIGLVARF